MKLHIKRWKNFLNFLPQMFNSSSIVALAGNTQLYATSCVKHSNSSRLTNDLFHFTSNLCRRGTQATNMRKALYYHCTLRMSKGRPRVMPPHSFDMLGTFLPCGQIAMLPELATASFMLEDRAGLSGNS